MVEAVKLTLDEAQEATSKPLLRSGDLIRYDPPSTLWKIEDGQEVSVPNGKQDWFRFHPDGFPEERNFIIPDGWLEDLYQAGGCIASARHLDDTELNLLFLGEPTIGNSKLSGKALDFNKSVPVEIRKATVTGIAAVYDDNKPLLSKQGKGRQTGSSNKDRQKIIKKLEKVTAHLDQHTLERLTAGKLKKLPGAAFIADVSSSTVDGYLATLNELRKRQK